MTAYPQMTEYVRRHGKALLHRLFFNPPSILPVAKPPERSERYEQIAKIVKEGDEERITNLLRWSSYPMCDAIIVRRAEEDLLAELTERSKCGETLSERERLRLADLDKRYGPRS